jgi:hypothetical protein
LWGEVEDEINDVLEMVLVEKAEVKLYLQILAADALGWWTYEAEAKPSKLEESLLQLRNHLVNNYLLSFINRRGQHRG